MFGVKRGFTCKNCGKRPNLWHRRSSSALHRWTTLSDFPHRHMSDKTIKLIIELGKR